MQGFGTLRRSGTYRAGVPIKKIMQSRSGKKGNSSVTCMNSCPFLSLQGVL